MWEIIGKEEGEEREMKLGKYSNEKRRTGDGVGKIKIKMI